MNSKTQRMQTMEHYKKLTHIKHHGETNLFLNYNLCRRKYVINFIDKFYPNSCNLIRLWWLYVAVKMDFAFGFVETIYPIRIIEIIYLHL